MFAQFLQFLFSGLTTGATYALAALGFTLVYNASGVINFAQGDFIAVGGMSAVALVGLGAPLPVAIAVAVLVTAAVGLLLEKLAIDPAGNASVETLIIITIGASLTLRGLLQVVLGKEAHALRAFSGDEPIRIGGATLLPQSLWVIGAGIAIVAGLACFFGRTRTGKAMLASSCNKVAAQLVGIDIRGVLLLSFGMAAALGGTAGVLIAPIAYASYDAGTMLGLKGFVAATLGGLGSGTGAIVGGILLGLAEAMTAGYLSSAYKDATAFVLILAVLFFIPQGLLGKKSTERV